jgi:hypothetical protein
LNSRSNRFMRITHGGFMTATFESEKDKDKDGNYKVDEDGNSIEVDKQDEGGDTPDMEIGKCSAL